MALSRTFWVVTALATAATAGTAGFALAEDRAGDPAAPAATYTLAQAADPTEGAEVTASADLGTTGSSAGQLPPIDVTSCAQWFEDWDDTVPDHVEDAFDEWDDRCDDLHDDDRDD